MNNSNLLNSSYHLPLACTWRLNKGDRIPDVDSPELFSHVFGYSLSKIIKNPALWYRGFLEEQRDYIQSVRELSILSQPEMIESTYHHPDFGFVHLKEFFYYSKRKGLSSIHGTTIISSIQQKQGDKIAIKEGTNLDFLSDLHDQLGLAHLLVNEHFEILDLNDTAIPLFEKSAEELVGSSLTSLAKIFDRQHNQVTPSELKNTLQIQIQKGFPYQVTLLINDSWKKVHCNAFKFYTGNEYHYLIVIVDKTNDLNKLADLKNRLQISSLIFDNNPVGICIYDQEGTILECNRSFVSILETREESIKGLNMVKDLQNEALIKEVQKSLNLLYGRYEGYYKSITGEGNPYVIVHFQPLVSEGGKLLGGVCLVHDITKLIERQHVIKRLNANLNGLLESSQDYIYAVDLDLNYTFFNKKHAQAMNLMFGADIHIGMSLSDVAPGHPNMITFIDTIKECYSGEFKIEIFDVTTENDTYYFENSFFPIYEDDKIIGASIFARDITSSIQLHEQIEKSEEQFRSITSNLSEGVYRKDARGHLIYVNPAFYTLFKIDKNIELNEIELDDLYVNKNQRVHLLEQLESEGHLTNIEVEFQRADHSTFWGMLNEKKNILSNDKVFYDGIVSDISEIKVAEQQLKSGQDSYRGLFQHASDGIILLDKNFTIINCNKKVENLFNHDVHWLVGSSIASLFFEMDEETPVTWSFTSQSSLKEMLGKKTDGTFFIASVKLQQGTYFGRQVLILFIEDITERKHQEQERIRLIQDLTKQNRDLQHFAKIISHDLRAPVANIQSLVSVFDFNDLTEEMKSQVIHGLKSTSIDMDQTLIDLNEIISVKNNISEAYEPVYLQRIVESVSKSLQRQIEQNNAVITTDFSALSQVISIKSYLQSIFHNLISNSIKYRHPNRIPEISIKSSLHLDQFCLTFSDNGIGIDLAKFEKKVFELYQRFHDHVEGRGLGLYLVKSEVEALNGTIELTSSVNVGTTFTILLPYHFNSR